MERSWETDRQLYGILAETTIDPEFGEMWGKTKAAVSGLVEQLLDGLSDEKTTLLLDVLQWLDEKSVHEMICKELLAFETGWRLGRGNGSAVIPFIDESINEIGDEAREAASEFSAWLELTGGKETPEDRLDALWFVVGRHALVNAKKSREESNVVSISQESK